MRATRYARSLMSGTGIIVLAGSLYACKDFLVTPPQGSLERENVVSEDGVEASLISAYRLLGGWTNSLGAAWGAAATNWPFGSVTSDDAYKGSDPADQPPITDLELYNWGLTGSSDYLEDKWTSLYEGINRANATLQLMNEVLEANPEEISEEDQQGIRGEALFLRAHYHFEAWKMWGNIPYYRENDEDFRKSNMEVDAIAEVLADLDEAISLLEPTPRRGEVGRVTQWTARAYKGRAQIYSGDYAGGLATLREVVDGGPYDLEPTYQRVWTAIKDFANGPETILAFQASANDGNPNGDNANYGQRLNFPHAGSPFLCCGFHQPSQNLVNYFAVDDAGLPLALSDDSWNDRDANFVAGASVAVDPRLDWTVGRDGVPYKDWASDPESSGIHEPDWIRDRGWAGPYSSKKNVHEFSSGAESTVGWNPTQLNSMNMHLFRYGDLLLLLAEAEVEVGSLENARAIVNQIRERAGVVAQGPGNNAANMAVPLDDSSITWAEYEIGLYTAPWTSQQFAREAVRAERRLELAMEGHRFFDLRRWGIAPQVLNDYLAVEATRRQYLLGASAVSDRHSLFPIPPLEIELSRVEGQDRLQQNAGW